MDYVMLAERRAFRDDKLQKIPVFESAHMFFDQYCLKSGQAQAVHTHAAEDKVYVVLAGEAMFDIGGEQELLPVGTAVIARAGVPHGVSNLSDSDLVLLVAMAPKPAH